VGIASGTATANATQEIAFGVGHGCSGSDTLEITVDIPQGVSTVRAMPNEFGKVKVNKDAAQTITSVTWRKADTDVVLGADDLYYKLGLRIKVPDRPFTTLFFAIHQTCRAADGTEIKVDWAAPTTNDSEDPNAPKPAAALVILPAKKPGWNKWTVPAAIPNLSAFFGDAQIVWKGSAAYSANPATLEQAKATAGVTELTALAAGDEIWVKY